MTLVELHAVLQAAFDALPPPHKPDALPTGLRADTAFAIGAAIGMISVAKALVGRDIEDGATG